VIVRYVTIYPSGRKEVHEYPSQTQVADVQRPAPRYLIDFGIFAFPVLLAALPLAFNGTRWRAPARVVAAALLASGVLLSSVGMFYLPSAVAMAVAAAFSFSGK
jgi:hypothetical protein